MTKSNKPRQKKAKPKRTTASAPSPVITARQERAMHALLAGRDDTAAAEAANVQRPTLNRWKNHDANFIAALNVARRDLADGFRDGLRALYGDAVEVLRDALDAEQPVGVRLRAAEAIIKNVATPDGETDPEAIRARWAMRRAEAEREMDHVRFVTPLSLQIERLNV